MLHRKIWDSDQVQRLKISERLFYIGLITYGDDHGRLRGDGAFLKRQFFHGDHLSVNRIEKMRDAIRDTGLIEVYSDKNGIYIAHPKWRLYQKLRAERNKDSEYPAPPSDTCQTDDGRASAEVRIGEGKINNDRVGEGKNTLEKQGISPAKALMLAGIDRAKIEGVNTDSLALLALPDNLPSLPMSEEDFDSSSSDNPAPSQSK